MKPVMNVDVDLVVVNPIPAWFAWFKKHSKYNLDFNLDWHKDSFNLELTMAKHMDIDPGDFWRNHKLYDDMLPMTNAPLILGKLSETYDIKFVTDSNMEHERSKKMFLLRHFDFDFEVIQAKADDKWQYLADIWVEDRVSTVDSLVQHQPECKVFHMINEINKSFEVFGATRVNNWTEIGRYLK